MCFHVSAMHCRSRLSLSVCGVGYSSRQIHVSMLYIFVIFEIFTSCIQYLITMQQNLRYIRKKYDDFPHDFAIFFTPSKQSKLAFLHVGFIGSNMNYRTLSTFT